MKDLVQALVDDESGAHSALVQALVERVTDEQLLKVWKHHAADVRAAAAEAAVKWPTGAVRDEILQEALSDRDEDVRIALARAMAEEPSAPVDEAMIAALLEDEDYEVRAHVCKAAGARGGHIEPLLVAVREDSMWHVRRAAATALRDRPPEQCFVAILHALAEFDDRDVSRACSETLDHYLDGADGAESGFGLPPFGVLSKCESRLRSGAKRYPKLAAWLRHQIETGIDVDALRSVGTDLTADLDRLPRAHGVDGILEPVQRILHADANRAVVLLGESGVGKTAAIHELVHRLHEDGWRTVRVGASDVMADTLYVGEWQTKVRKLIDAAKAPRKVLLYVPNLQELADAGRSAKSDMNVATMLAPHIANGELAIVGESTVEGFRRGVGADPALRSLFTAIEVQPASETSTRSLLDVVCEDAEAEAPSAALDRLMELGDYFSPGAALPGRAVSLLRRVLDRVGDETPVKFDADDVLATLGETTGIPTRILDDSVALDLNSVRETLTERVMGQREATEAVLDLVTLIKAGLTDPGKPFGVLMFVGPTGVGKTELARGLAELLFGDAGRLRRFDMSEYATFDAFERLIGTDKRAGLLTAAVKEQPFSVILFDEIEKAHSNVFDLCLQIFDAGRLTDAQGRTADFRRCIIVLTSNIGSAVPSEKPLGFGGDAPPPPESADTMREIRRFFRPEFLNRIDRIVHFDPLNEETAERIARRELARVLERSGLTRRGLTVDVDPSVMAFLLRRGYSRAFGARPLKRTVERFVLLPVARAIASGTAPDCGVLRLTVRGNDVVVKVIAEETDDREFVEPSADLLALRAEVDAVTQAAVGAEEQKADFLAATRLGNFWDDPVAARHTLDRIHRLDRVFEDVERLRRDLEMTAGNRDAGRQAEFARAHALEARRLLRLLTSGDLADAFVTITRVKKEGGDLNGVVMLARMYMAFAKRRQLEVEILDDRLAGDPVEDTITLLVGGAGAYELLRGEHGLHRLSRMRDKQKNLKDRELARIEVYRGADDTRFADADLQIETRTLKATTGRISQPRLEAHLLHRPTMTAVLAHIAGRAEEAREKLEPLLKARVAAPEVSGEAAMVRYYRLGPAPMVSDHRTGRKTGRLDRVLAGELESFLIPLV